VSRCVLITGASGDLGAAFARRYAASVTTLLLWSRDPDRLEMGSARVPHCRRGGSIRSLELTNPSIAVAALKEDDAATPVSVAIFASGAGDIRAHGHLIESPELVTRLCLVNFVTPCVMATALAAQLATLRQGQISLVGSAAAFHTLPFAMAYCFKGRTRAFRGSPSHRRETAWRHRHARLAGLYRYRSRALGAGTEGPSIAGIRCCRVSRSCDRQGSGAHHYTVAVRACSTDRPSHSLRWRDATMRRLAPATERDHSS
jgi:hypothetical protein